MNLLSYKEFFYVEQCFSLPLTKHQALQFLPNLIIIKNCQLQYYYFPGLPKSVLNKKSLVTCRYSVFL